MLQVDRLIDDQYNTRDEEYVSMTDKMKNVFKVREKIVTKEI